MAVYSKFENFNLDLGRGVHQLQAAGHTLKVYATNATPNGSTNTVKADLLEITAQNGYPAGGSDIQNDYTRSGATSSLTGVDVVWTATGGSFGPLQHVPMYNDTPTSPADPLVAWWPYGSSLTVNDGESLTVDFQATIFGVT